MHSNAQSQCNILIPLDSEIGRTFRAKRTMANNRVHNEEVLDEGVLN